MSKGNTGNRFAKGRPLVENKVHDNPLYVVWCGIKTRCYNNRAANYKYYGAKGIIMCDEWKNDFNAFYTWAIISGWKPGLTIDRYPNNEGIYSPDNCRIATKKQQANNRGFENVRNNFKDINERRRIERLNK